MSTGMRMTVVGVAALATTAAFGGPQAQRAPQPTTQPAPAPRPASAGNVASLPASAVLPNTQALFDGYVRDGKMPGVVGAFGVGAMPTVFPAAGSISDDAGAPVAGPDSLWRIYSMTKPVTGMAAMILIEEGKLKLDQPIGDFFPAYKSMRVLTSPDNSLDSVPAKRPITIRHLLTHTSGLGYSIVQKGPIQQEYERLGIVPAALNPAVEAQARAARPKTLAEFAERTATLPLVYEPGTKWSYSIGLDVLGAVIEKASGMPFERFLETRLFMPLGMTSTWFTVPRSEVVRFATNYVFTGEKRTPIDAAATSVFLEPPSFPYGGAGLVSTARDYDRFLHMLQNGGELGGARIMKPETVALGMSNLLPAGLTFPGIDSRTGGASGEAQQGFGAGGAVYIADVPNGASKGTYGWGGAAGTIGFVDPARRTRGTIMVQYFPAEKWPVRQEASAALAKDAARFRQR